MTLYAIAVGLGAIDKTSTRTSSGGDYSIAAEQFVAMFGPGGELGATGTVH